jgi:hypothetical protein
VAQPAQHCHEAVRRPVQGRRRGPASQESRYSWTMEELVKLREAYGNSIWRVIRPAVLLGHGPESLNGPNAAAVSQSRTATLLLGCIAVL